MKIKSLPECERPLEKARAGGIGCLSDAELLAVLIHTGSGRKSSLNLAEEVLALMDDGLSELGSMDISDLMGIDGIGLSKAVAILAAAELGRRMAYSPRRPKLVADSSQSVADMFMEKLRYEKKEYFKSLLINTKGEVIFVDDISVGGLSSAMVHPREAFKNAVKKSAASIIFVHNHPSGDPQPSEADVETTNRLVRCGSMLGIDVLDHLVIGDGKYVSMRAEGLIAGGSGGESYMN